MKKIIAFIFSFTLFLSCDRKEIFIHAILDDDLSNIHLTFYDDYTFETLTNTYLSTKTIKGKYKIENDTIFFLDMPYDNDFIPEKILVKNDKLILKYDEKGNIDTSFANFFRIKQLNYLTNKHINR